MNPLRSVEAIWSSPVEWVAEQLAGLPSQPARRAVVLVAAERQAHAIRRHVCLELARPHLLAGVRFLRPVELAREALVRSGRVRLLGWEVVRRLRIVQLFESCALADELHYFSAAQLRSGHGYVEAFARTIADLEAGGLEVDLAVAVAQRLSRRDRMAADRLHDVAVTWRAADAGARVRGTTAQVLAEAAARMAASPHLLDPLGPFVAVLTASPSTVLLRFLCALPRCQMVLQEARPQRTDTQRWRPLIDVRPSKPAEPTGTELGLVQRFLFELPETLTDPQRARSAGADGTVDIEEYASVEDEIEAAATWVTEQLAAGIPAEQMALVVPEIDPYAGLLVDRLARLERAPDTASEPARLGVYVAGGLSLAASPAGMRVRGLLNAIARGLEAEATIRVVPALRRGQQTGSDLHERLTPSRAADIVYGAGIVGGTPGDPGGLTEWLSRLTRRRDAMRQVVAAAAALEAATAAESDDNDEPEKRHLDARARHDAERWLRDVDPILPAIAALQELTQAIFAGAALAAVWNGVRSFCERWLRIPPDPPNLLVMLDQALQPILDDPLAQTITGPAGLRVVMDTLQRHQRPTARFGEPCVFVGTSSHAAGVPFRAVRILGLAEGALPHTPHDDPIVPDSLRRHIEEAARAQQAAPDVVLPRLADHVLDDIHDVFRVIAGACGRVALSAPRQWVDRSEREVSGVMLEVATALGRPAADGTADGTADGDVPTAARLRAAYINPGRAARRRRAHESPLSPRALLTAPLAATPGARAVPAGWTRADALAVDRLWQLTDALESHGLGEVDGVVTSAWAAVSPVGLVPQRPISATALTTLLGCPHRFLLERILYLTEPATRPSTDVIAPMAYGSLFHAAADRFFREAGPALCRREGELDEWVARAREIATEEFNALRHSYPMRGADGIARERARLLRQIEQLVHYEWQLTPREFLESEFPFGTPDPVRLEVDSGELYVRGAIDRIDRLGKRALSVRDLKTGRVRDFGEEPINAGRDLQLGLYVLALEATGFGDARVAAAAYVHPSAAQEPDRAFLGAELEVLRRQTREWASVARRLLSTGSFPRTPNPEDCTYCPFRPACGEDAQQHSAAKLHGLPPSHPLEAFAHFKRKREDDDR